MEPIGLAALRLVANATATGVLAGLFGGLIVWWARMRLRWGAPLAFAIFMALLVVNGFNWPYIGMEVVYGVPPLIMTFAIYMLLACGMARVVKIHRAWIALAVFLLTFGIGLAYLFLYRVSMAMPANVAVVADVVLVLGAATAWFRRRRGDAALNP